jgi:hypothetical protein
MICTDSVVQGSLGAVVTGFDALMTFDPLLMNVNRMPDPEQARLQGSVCPVKTDDIVTSVFG